MPRRCFQQAYGDVSLVLAAMGAEKFLPAFQKHDVSFDDMLALNEDALCKASFPAFKRRKHIN